MNQRREAIASENYWEFQPGERVMTIDGYPGRVDLVEDGPIGGAENYAVTLDGGMGGGNYSASMLTKMPTSRSAAGVHLATDDYPELGTVLDDRPDPGKMTFTAAATTLDPEADDDQPHSCSYCGGTEFKDLADNGRVRQATCATCNGTMSAHPGAQWTPELIGDPSNHPKAIVDPRSGASGAAGMSSGINDSLDFDSRVSTTAAQRTVSWDEIGDRHPHVYGDADIHGEDADGADGPGIGDAANYLAHERPEDPDAENSSVHNLDFHPMHVHPRHIDYKPSGPNDPRVRRAREGYQKDPDAVPPLVLVHRHGVYQVADGHHRAEAAHGLDKPVRAYVAHSPHPDEPFRDGEKGPFHGAEPEPARKSAALAAEHGISHVYRGVHGPFASGAAEANRSGDLGSGMYGKGFYTTSSPDLATSYAQAHGGDRSGVFMHGQIHPDASIAHLDDVPKHVQHGTETDWAREHGHDVLTDGVHTHVVANPHAITWDPKNYDVGEAYKKFNRWGEDYHGGPADLHTAALAGHDWCTWRREARCTFPGDSTAVSLAIPQDRGPCPWETPWQQQVCPISEPGPMALMQAKGSVAEDDDTKTIPTKRVGFAGYVEGEKTNFGNHGDNSDWEDEQAVGQHSGVHEFRGYSGRENDFKHWHEKGEIGPVPLHGPKVYATQPRVTKRGVDTYLSNPEHKSGSGRPNYPANDRPIFVKHGGDYYTLDGHHRTAAAMLRGDKHVEGHVYDADKHGFPEAEWAPSQFKHLPKSLEKYSALAGAHLGCGFDTDDEDEALQHELSHHDDGFCSARGHQRIAARKDPEPGAMLRTAARDRDFGFHITASWADVQRKAKRIRAEGGVTIVIASNDGIGGHVVGDHGTYEALLVYRPGTKKVADWTCGCKWAAYAWDRSPGFQRFEGRKCSHALALQFEAQSQGMFGKEVHPAEAPPGRSIVKYDPDADEHVFARPYQGSLIGSLVARLRAEDADPAETIGNLIRAGVHHRTAVLLWKDAGKLGPQFCEYCDSPATKAHMWAEHMAYIPTCDEHAQRAVDRLEGQGDEVEAVKELPQKTAAEHREGSTRNASGTTLPIEISSTDQASARATVDDHRLVRVPMSLRAGELASVHGCGGLPGQYVRPEGASPQMIQSDTQPMQAGLSTRAMGIPVVTSMVDDELGWNLSSGHQPHEAMSVEVLPFEHNAAVAVPPSGADPHVAPFFLGEHDLAKSASGQDLAQPSVAGLCLKAHDTGRILMLQRGLDDENDPAAGTWEMPGGHIEPDDPTSLHAALREWQEEVGQSFPAHGTVKHTWTSPDGIYQGHVVVIPSEKDLTMHHGRVVPNPDDPKGDNHEQAAWWEVEHAKKNPALRDEVKAHTPWKEIEKATLDAKTASAWDPISNTNPQPGRGTSEPAHSNTTNPASTGWAAGEDPDNWDNLNANPEPLTPSLGFDSALHDRPEPALPVAYGDENATMRPAEMTQVDLDPIPDNPPQAADLVPDSDANIHLLNGGSALPNSYHASVEGDRVAEIVASFQKSAVGQQLVAEASGGGDEEIAAAARAHLAKEGAKEFAFAEQQELIGEGAADGRRARNLGSLQIKGTHYELLDAALAGEAVDSTDLFI